MPVSRAAQTGGNLTSSFTLATAIRMFADGPRLGVREDHSIHRAVRAGA